MAKELHSTSSANGSASPATLVDTAYSSLRDRILSVDLRPGQVIAEADLTAMLGMSRTPLRDAISRLSFEGLVHTLPRRGVQVAPITPRDVREINEVLACLEVQAVGDVASRQIDKDEMAALDAAIAAMDRAIETEDPAAWAAADFEFHRLLFDLSSNRHLRKTAQLYLEKAHRARLLTLPMRKSLRYSNSNHAAVVEAIRRNDPETARDIHQRHKDRWASELDMLMNRYPDIFDVSAVEDAHP